MSHPPAPLHLLKSFHRSATNDIYLHLFGQIGVVGSPVFAEEARKVEFKLDTLLS